jgi:hypothetical protein
MRAVPWNHGGGLALGVTLGSAFTRAAMSVSSLDASACTTAQALRTLTVKHVGKLLLHQNS